MAGVAGKSGRKLGSQNDKPWREAIMRAVNEADGDEKKLHRIARALVTQAVSGDVSAIKEIGDRLDGKPRQEIDAVIEQHRYVARIPAPAENAETWLATRERLPTTPMQ
jgi:hypothetical protein